jgi:hypothetical protein
MARGALDLSSSKPFVALQVLFAMRAGKLELAHGTTLAGAPVWAIAELRWQRLLYSMGHGA